MNNKEIGNFGEEMAAKYLEYQGYEIEEKNFRCRLGEVDIIAKKDNYIVFFEVKTRTSEDWGMPRESIDQKKINKIRKVAAVYMMWRKVTNYQVKFDVVEVYCNHIENAF